MPARDHRIIVLLAVLAVTSVLVALLLLMLVPVPKENRDIVNILLGALVTSGFGAVYAYYFGSSRGSDRKTDALLSAPPAAADATGELPPGERVEP